MRKHGSDQTTQSAFQHLPLRTPRSNTEWTKRTTILTFRTSKSDISDPLMSTLDLSNYGLCNNGQAVSVIMTTLGSKRARNTDEDEHDLNNKFRVNGLNSVYNVDKHVSFINSIPFWLLISQTERFSKSFLDFGRVAQYPPYSWRTRSQTEQGGGESPNGQTVERGPSSTARE